MTELRDKCTSKPGNSQFWSQVQDAGRKISLISDEEAEEHGGTSLFSESEAEKLRESPSFQAILRQRPPSQPAVSRPPAALPPESPPPAPTQPAPSAMPYPVQRTVLRKAKVPTNLLPRLPRLVWFKSGSLQYPRLTASESVRPSHFPPTDPIPVVVKDMLKCKKNEEIKAEKPAKRAKPEPKKERKRGGTKRGATKRKAHDEIDDEKPAKRARTHHKKAQEGPSKSAKNPPASRPTTRYTGTGKR
ncbi:hypothetical protein K438DRAFT_1750351 [Mycena galopus ATCC 62051]|nr:hypothetical protein K438DRAFT_1750351 [Mycena galopus ATCC 62051]